jgi:hypothetical protein
MTAVCLILRGSVSLWLISTAFLGQAIFEVGGSRIITDFLGKMSLFTAADTAKSPFEWAVSPDVEPVPKAVSQSLCRNPLSEHFVQLGHFQRKFDKVFRQRSTTKLGMSLETSPNVSAEIYMPTPSIRFKESCIAWLRSLRLSWRFSKS